MTKFKKRGNKKICTIIVNSFLDKSIGLKVFQILFKFAISALIYLISFNFCFILFAEFILVIYFIANYQCFFIGAVIKSNIQIII